VQSAPVLDEPLTVNLSATLNATGEPDHELLSVPASAPNTA
jgi:hypothetical protein